MKDKLVNVFFFFMYCNFLSLHFFFYILQKTTHKKKEKPKTQAEDVDTDIVNEITDNIKLPSSVFASEIEEDVGLLNKAASQGNFFL